MAKPSHLKFNDPAPDVTLLDANGQPVKLSSLWQKKVLVLAFTRHFGCPQCKEMVDQLISAHQALADSGLLLAIISHASAESAKAFCEQRAPSAICLADPNRDAYHAYGLYRGTFWQTLLSPQIWRSNRRLAREKGYKPEVPLSGQDAYQMSGTFIIGMDGRIRLPYYYEDIADHPPVDLLLHGIMGVDWKKPFDSNPVV
ncbi:MAG TPA: peroxiredoxin-like family protein [Anaerolineales bacterium]|nr:peroxiredoxin-like family protein [Anaerolineales bacterium]HNA88742.1 peroxiredoxin-like family protein [Anaerolineales bacterium]HNB35999.1 peroxiredoxin-like family protein [Anaerolineales bacterium]HNC07908.1 peroxiredoxin-like family protein [Anaerolineales bacterium]